jgi:hypothetical protein
MSNATLSPDNKTAKPRPSLVPPDEKFWVRYSQHHEFPLSTVSSVVLHVLAIVVLFMAGWIALKLGWTKEDEPVKIEPVALGGGNPRAPGPGTNERAGGGNDVEQPDSKPENEPPRLANLDKIPDLPPITDLVDLVAIKDPDGLPVISAQTKKTLDTLAKLDKSIREDLAKGLRGNGGGGDDKGGKDKGKDGGRGNATGPGDGKGVTPRMKRILRWTMNFDTASGEDYARQLHALGAILAHADTNGKYIVVRDLSKRPARGSHEDLAKIQRIYWIEDNPRAVTDLCSALGIRPVPPLIVAFFPETLENKLLRLELAFAGKKEDQIESTKFQVIRSGTGYDVRVTSQH